MTSDIQEAQPGRKGAASRYDVKEGNVMLSPLPIRLLLVEFDGAAQYWRGSPRDLKLIILTDEVVLPTKH